MESLNRNARHIFLSPHLDDVVLSCGGLIARAISLSCPVDVVTFCTKLGDPDALPRRQREAIAHVGTYEQRKGEDAAALRVLGATPTWLDYTERFFRHPWLKSSTHIFRTPMEPGLNGFANVAPMKQYLTELCAEFPDAYLFAPLGAGNHHDHVEVFLAGIMTAVENKALDRFMFYEDFYSLGTRMRKRHYIASRVCWKWWQAPESCSLKWLSRSNRMASQARGRPLPDYLPADYARLQWTAEACPILEFEDRKLEAMSKYETQMGFLGGMPMLAAIYRRYHRFWGGAEAYWTAREGHFCE